MRYREGVHQRWFKVGICVLAALFPSHALLAQTGIPGAEPLVFEAEAYSTPAETFTYNRLTENAWNVWSTDKDADKKWSGGVVLQSPKVLADRPSAEAGAPPIYTKITGIPNGRYSVVIKLGRTLAISRNGSDWESDDKGSLGTIEITDGTFEIWVDDRYANANPGSSYYDSITFYPLPARTNKPLVTGSQKTRVTENLDRGFVAIPSAGKVYLGWRLLEVDGATAAGTGAATAAGTETGFNVYREDSNGIHLLNSSPILTTTDYVDAKPASGDASYFIKPATAGREGPASNRVAVGAVYSGSPAYRTIKLRGAAAVQKAAIADLDGDGQYDFVFKTPDVNVDPYANYWVKSKGTYSLEAYRHDGTFLWSRDLGWSIEQGIWYSPYIVYDFDGDGKAEVALKTGEGDPREADGRVTSGSEWLTILDGSTGREIAKTAWPSREGFPDYNYYSRNQLGVAYLDGKTPCIIVERGTYNTIKVEAYEFTKSALRKVWAWTDAEEGVEYRGQGSHILRAADVDGDGRDEVILGSAVLDDNGIGLWSTGLGHPDCVTVGDLDPRHPGLEIQYNLETKQQKYGMCMVDAATGKILWGLNIPTAHVHSSGLCADIDATHPGSESFGGERDDPAKRWLLSAQGVPIAVPEFGSLAPRAAWWDQDIQREIVSGSRIWDYGTVQANGAKIEGTVIAVADIIGDWREEVITSTKGEVRLYTTAIPAQDRRLSLMRDPIYRNGVALFSQAYFQISGMAVPLEAKALPLPLDVLAPGSR